MSDDGVAVSIPESKSPEAEPSSTSSPSPSPSPNEGFTMVALHGANSALMDGEEEEDSVEAQQPQHPQPLPSEAQQPQPQHRQPSTSVPCVPSPDPTVNDVMNTVAPFQQPQYATRPDDPPNNIFHPVSFTGPPPPPSLPVSTLRPDEQFEDLVRRRLEAQKAREDAAAGEQAAAQASGTVLGKMRAAFSKARVAVDKTVQETNIAIEKTIREKEHERSAARLATAIPALATECLVASYECQVMSHGQRVPGELFICEKHIAFSARHRHFGFYLKWSDVLSLQPAVVLETQFRWLPFILPIPSPYVLPTCIQLFTRHSTIIQFCGFDNVRSSIAEHTSTAVTGRAVDRAYSYIDHCWRSATQVPDPNYDWGAGGTQPQKAIS